MSALDRQIEGTHYKQFPIQPVELIAANGYDYFIGNILKYVCRWRFKGGLSDLQKALHYAELRRDIALHRHESPVVDRVERIIARLWHWRMCIAKSPEKRFPISMNTFVEVNDIPPYDDHILYALDQWHRRMISADQFIVTLRTFIRVQFPDVERSP
jgi:Protein of unknwon function (DUF3310).